VTDRAVALRVLAVYLASRCLAFAGVLVAAVRRPEYGLALHLSQWDANWYLLTARHGYPHHLPTAPGQAAAASTIGFFPAFPMTVRAVHVVTRLPYLAAAVLVNLAFGYVAMLLLWRLACRLTGRDVADRTVLLFLLFPASLALLMPYTEGMFFTFAIGSLLALLDRRWAVAGLLAALAGATRPTGIVLAFCCAWAAVVALRRDRDWRALLAPLLAPLGTVGYFGFLWWHTGSPTAWWTVERLGWAQRTDFGKHAFEQAWYVLTTGHAHPYPGIPAYDAVPGTIGLLLVLVMVPFLVRWRPPAVVAIYAALTVLMPFTTEVLSSRPRYAWAAFPLFVGVARAVHGAVFWVLVAATAVALPVVTVVTLTTHSYTP
jgi:hypothetical protein